jgi:uncharacterized membrane protein AbrB (regulator of aidB expression)
MNNTIDYIVKTSFFTAFAIVISVYGIAYFFENDGFSLMEVAFLPFLIGLIFIILSFTISFVFLIKYNNLTGKTPIKSIYYIAWVSLVSLILIFITDTFMHTFFDKELSKKYAKKLIEIAIAYKKPTDDIENLSNFPFLFQNWTICLIGMILGNFFSWMVFRIYKENKLK